jgi:hypothetical protein
MVVTPIVSIGLLHLWKEGGRRLLLTAAVLALAFAAYVEWGIYRRDHHAAELRELREEIEILTDQLTLSRYAGHPRIANLVQLGSVFSSQASISESSHDLEGTRHALKKAEELLTSASETAKAAEMASDARDRFLQECNATCSTEPETEARSRRAEQAWEMGDFREAASQWRDAALPKVRKPDRR